MSGQKEDIGCEVGSSEGADDEVFLDVAHVVWIKFTDDLCQGSDITYRLILNIQAFRSSEKSGNLYQTNRQISVGEVLTENRWRP